MMNRVRPNYYKHPDVRETELVALRSRVEKLTELAHEQQHALTKKTMQVQELEMYIARHNLETHK